MVAVKYRPGFVTADFHGFFLAEACLGPAQNLPALIRRVFPEAVAKVLRKSYYKLRLVPIEDVPRWAEAAHARQPDIENDINTRDFLKMLDKRSRQVVYRRIIPRAEAQ